MRNSSLLTTVLGIFGVAILAAYFWATTHSTQAVAANIEDHAGPTLEITVSGEANGVIKLKLFEDVAPQHVERLVTLANEGAYDNVVFHRVIDGFMAQSGDVQFGKVGAELARAGTGGSEYDDLPAEFSDLTFARGSVGMARSSDPNSANSQFFIMFAPAAHLDGQYTIVGQIAEGLDVLDAIKLGKGPNGSVIGDPDIMSSVKVVK